MVGDQADMVARMRAVIPVRWFPDEAPILNGVLSGLGAAWAWAFDLLSHVKAQTRLATASGVWLDVIAQDFCGARLMRRGGEGDDAFRNRIRRELLRERGTRSAVVAVLEDLTGRTPDVFEPGLTSDTGGYNSAAGGGGGIGYGVAGGWGSLSLPFQSFVTAFRPIGSGISLIAGWGAGAGGYGAGAIEYASLSMIQGQVTDEDIYAAVAGVLPVAAIAWTRITD